MSLSSRTIIHKFFGNDNDKNAGRPEGWEAGKRKGVKAVERGARSVERSENGDWHMRSAAEACLYPLSGGGRRSEERGA